MLKVIEYDQNNTNINDIIVRSQLHYNEINNKVSNIIDSIRSAGDKALYDYTEQFDKVRLNSFEISKEQIDKAYESIDKELRETLLLAYDNIRKYHSRQLRNNFFTNNENGVFLGQIINPIERVGIYVPGGTASYPSTVLMNAVPAQIAGVKEIILVSPPNREGYISDIILASAKIAGIHRVFSIGGAQAIAALAYGTESIPKVHKIVGPGNIYVAAAKRQVFGEVGIDMFAGPSEILIIADNTAKPNYLAADMLSQAEHDEMASSVLITTSKQIAHEVKKELEIQLKKLERKEIAQNSLMNNGRIIIVENINQAVYLSNILAPEHLEICVEDPFSLLGQIKNAGSIFLGNYSPEPLGDYFAGPNHTLPTSGTACFSSPLSVDDFIKKSSVIYYTKHQLEKVKDHVIRFAKSEGLDAHAEAIEERFK